MNLNENNQSNIDYEFKPIKEKLGGGYETFKHIQYNKNMEQFIAIIVSGMKMPEDQVMKLNEKYKEKSKAIDKSRDDGFKNIRSLVGNKEDGRYDMMRARRRSAVKQQPTNSNNTRMNIESEY
jgi:hypothetical protein